MSYASKVSSKSAKIMSNLDLVNAQRKRPVEQKVDDKDLEAARRTTAFVAIYNKPEAKKEKTKTQMCRSVQSGIVCKFGSRCTYAHSKEELRVQKCAFGTTCKTRYSKTNPCRFDHSEEHTPPPTERYDAAQEMKSYWENEEAQMQAILARFKESRPKPEPFLIDLSDEDEDSENAEGALRVIIPVNNEPDIQIINDDYFDEEMKAILALGTYVVPRLIMANTMNLFEGGRPYGVEGMEVLP